MRVISQAGKVMKPILVVMAAVEKMPGGQEEHKRDALSRDP
jgi:hypothetical protein